MNNNPRFRVIYKDLNNKRKETEVTAGSKLKAASIVLSTIAIAVVEVIPIIKGKSN